MFPGAEQLQAEEVSTAEKVAELFKSHMYFDYEGGRLIKTDFSKFPNLSIRLYDRDFGQGAAQRAIEAYAKTPSCKRFDANDSYEFVKIVASSTGASSRTGESVEEKTTRGVKRPLEGESNSEQKAKKAEIREDRVALLVKEGLSLTVQEYLIAAAQGNASAQYNLGPMHEHGQGGLRQSDEEAVKWYKLAAAQRDKDKLDSRSSISIHCM